MALKFNGNTVQKINWNGGTDNVKILKYPDENTIVWCHPYLMTWSVTGTGVNLDIERTTATEPSVSTGTLVTSRGTAESGTVQEYYQDQVKITARAVDSSYRTPTVLVDGSSVGTLYTLTISNTHTIETLNLPCNLGSTCTSNTSGSICSSCTSTSCISSSRGGGGCSTPCCNGTSTGFTN